MWLRWPAVLSDRGNTVRKRTAALAACFLLSLLGTALLASPASAAKEDCASQQVCLWNGAAFGGERVDIHNNGWQNLTGFDDKASSVFNHTNRDAQIAIHGGGEGEKLCIHSGQSFSLENMIFNNNASSVRLIAPPGGC
jgi:hypothetical protein